MNALRLTTIRSNLIAGILTLIPLLVVWVVLDFVFAMLFAVGSPVAGAVTVFVTDRIPNAAPILMNPLFQWLVAIVMALLLLYTVGAIASRVVGMKLLAAVEGLIARIPVIETVYSASKQLIGMLQPKADGAARVVLVDFLGPDIKAIGLVMRLFKDATTGEELAAVFLPKTPNPTSGYLEIIPVRKLVPTAMTMDQAITMIVSGGAIAPDHISLAGTPRSPASVATA